MALRVMVYTGLLYQDLIKQKQIAEKGKLPPVFPIVIYNGEKRWSAARNINELIQEVPGGLQAYLPSQRYHLLDEGRTAPNADNNRISDIIALERGLNPAQLQELISQMTEQLKGDQNRELRRAFTVWINRVVLKRLVPETEIPEVNELSEVKEMLAERVTQWTEEWKQQGMQQGMQQGEGRMLLRQLMRRFGLVSPEIQKRLQSATTEQLEHWAENFVDAEKIEEVFR